MALIRFSPDTWGDALLRPLAMTAPDANVYVEIAAPDLRLAAVQILALGLLLLWTRLRSKPPAALIALLAFAVACMPPWLLTSGNGRYFIPILLAAGPLAVGLVLALPLSRRMQLALVAGLLAGQVFVVSERPPWDAWAWSSWGQGNYFQVDVPKADDPRPVTYVTLSSISYSLIAPQFPPQSRWINVASVGEGRRDTAWGREFIARSPGPIRLLAPTIPGQLDAQGLPIPDVRDALDKLLAPHGLALAGADACTLLRSGGLRSIGTHAGREPPKEPVGFWQCSLKRQDAVNPVPQEPVSPQALQALAKVEQMCPRFFQHGEGVLRIPHGVVRHYPDSDMKVYVLNDGRVLYKFWRALNPVEIGTVAGLLDGTTKFDCSFIRGRSGLPWNREI
ncbi:hypothetical protein [Ramlibacter sp. PS4R-6]|uniref:hypothetical protein n=1 Tax=Ramlibacter sp. PS4R-6 TaxID=3133438 RepID=UPI003099A132